MLLYPKFRFWIIFWIFPIKFQQNKTNKSHRIQPLTSKTTILQLEQAAAAPPKLLDYLYTGGDEGRHALLPTHPKASLSFLLEVEHKTTMAKN